jgi:hypothetical protein
MIINNIVTLISYVLTATNKRYSYLRVMAVQIDVQPAGENLIHMTRTLLKLVHVPHTCFLRAVHVRGNLSLAINSVGRTLLLPRKRVPDTILNTPAH